MDFQNSIFVDIWKKKLYMEMLRKHYWILTAIKSFLWTFDADVGANLIIRLCNKNVHIRFHYRSWMKSTKKRFFSETH